MLSATTLLKVISQVTVEEVERYLIKHGGLHRYVTFPKKPLGQKMQTLRLVCEDFSGGALAMDVGPLVFLGGPPGPVGRFKGTLLTVFADVILNHWHTKKTHGNSNKITVQQLAKH